jgi:hypothetical protein
VVDPAFIGTAHMLGMEVHVWTINDAAEMRELLDLGVDGLVTDRPDLLREVLAERGQWPDQEHRPDHEPHHEQLPADERRPGHEQPGQQPDR